MARIPIKRLLPTTLAIAAPGWGALAALALLGALGPSWAVAGAILCFVVAMVVASFVVGDLTALAAYSDALSGNPNAPEPTLSGWGPAAHFATHFRRFIREAKRNEQALRENMDSSQMVFDGLPQPLLLVDDGRKVLRVNRTARSLIGTDPSGSDLASAFRDPRILAEADAALAEGQPKAVGLTIQDPVERYFSVQIVPLELAGGDGAALLVALFDLTERRRAEQMRADFIANASHELRTPLASLIGFIETLRGPARDDAEARERFLGLMADQAARMGRLVEDLLALSAIELAEHTPPHDRVEIASVLDRVVAGLELEAAARDMTIERDLAKDLPLVLGDGDRLAQLFQNLIDNAIKYGREGTPITVSARFEDKIPATLGSVDEDRHAAGAVRVAVIDRGEGIDAEHIPRLTERFYRVDTARSRAIGGTGLGLAIVKHIVSHHRGHLEIDSERGVGSTFAVYLPQMPAGDASEGARAVPSRAADVPDARDAGRRSM